MKIRNDLGILSSDVPTGNLVWVDQVNGNDMLAVRGRMTIPFKTLGAARYAAKPAVFDANGNVTEAGDTIVVLPGAYPAAFNLAKHGVNWHFCNGAVVDHAAVGDGVFSTMQTGSCRFQITGAGVFYSNRIFLDSYHSDDHIRVECASIDATEGVRSSGEVMLRCDSLKAHSYSVAGVGLSLSRSVIIADTIWCDGAGAVFMDSGVLEVYANRIVSLAGPAISILDGELTVSAAVIEATSGVDQALFCDMTGGICRIRGARLSSAGIAEAVLVFAGSEKLVLKDCTLVGGTSASVSIDAANPDTKVILNGSLTMNKGKGNNVKFDPSFTIQSSAVT